MNVRNSRNNDRNARRVCEVVAGHERRLPVPVRPVLERRRGPRSAARNHPACDLRQTGPPCGQRIAQTMSVTTAIRMAAGTNQPVTVSARRWIGVRLRFAHHPHDLCQQRITPDLLGFHGKAARAVHRAGDHRLAAVRDLPLVSGPALAAASFSVTVFCGASGERLDCTWIERPMASSCDARIR